MWDCLDTHGPGSPHTELNCYFSYC